MPEPRQVVPDDEILSLDCPKCFSLTGYRCQNREGRIITNELREVAFHRERIMQAFLRRMQLCLGIFSVTDKSLIMFHAFVMLCDSVSTKATELFGRECSSLEVQKFFAGKAIAELRKDGLIE